MSLAEILQELSKLSGDERSVVLRRLRELEDRGGALVLNESAGYMVQGTRTRPSSLDHPAPKPDLSPVITAKLRELAALKPGWDEEDALPIDPKAIEETAHVIARLSSSRDFQNPQLVPTFDGFLQVEWHNATRSLEFESTPRGWSVLGVDSVNSPSPKYYKAATPFKMAEALEPFYVWFATHGLTWPSQ